MTVQSMTGYGYWEGELGNMKLACQIRTINHRYFEWKPRIPQAYLSVEEKIKSRIREKINRGVVEVFVKREGALSSSMAMHERTLRGASDGIRKIAAGMGIPPAVINDRLFDWVLKFPDVLSKDSMEALSDEEELFLLEGVGACVDQVAHKRNLEGKHLSAHCEKILTDLHDRLIKIAAKAAEVPKAWKEKLAKRMSEWEGVTISPERMDQEMIMFAERMDVSEEIHRLESHFKHFRDFLHRDGPKGKKLDFYIQEIHREMNTIGSKVSDTKLSLAAMEMKSGLEQLREQVQNIE